MEIPVPKEQVFFVGENGQGKTNFLEAIYLSCYGKSFRSSTDSVLLRHGQNEMSVAAFFSFDQDKHRISETRVVVKAGKKEITLDGKTIQDRKDLIDRVPCIVFCHDDLSFVRGGPEFQRQFFDQTASLLYPVYLDDLRNYNKVLKTRNFLLREQKIGLLSVYDGQLAALGLLLRDHRIRIVDQFNTLFGDFFFQVSGGIREIHIEYKSSWKGLSLDEAVEKLKERLPRDMQLRTTTSGPHRDKFIFLQGDRNFTESASTGQFRLMSLLLRLAQANMVRLVTGKKPVLLLDDVLLELDFEKRKRFLSLLPEHEQAFFTFLPDEDIGAYVKHDALCYSVEQGRFREKSR